MEVILKTEVPKLGGRGDVVKVAAGFARNYLLPRKLAIEATHGAKKSIDSMKAAALRKETKLRGDAEQLAALMKDLVVTVVEKAGDSDQLFGSVTAKDVAEALEKSNFTIDRRKIQLDEPIKTLGEHKLPVRLHRNVTVEVTVNVVREG